MTHHFLFVVCALLLGPSAFAAHSAITPAPKDGRWMQRHESFVARAAEGDINVLFLGDSITDFWRRSDGGAPVWEREFAPLGAANFGISADRTQHVLWRLENGEADGYEPKVVVLLIGTNNTGFERTSDTPRNSTGEVVEGVTAVVGKVREKFSDAHIIFHAIFPRGNKDDPQRSQIDEINAALARLHDGEHVIFFDIGNRFLDADGEIPRELMPDLLHPSQQGYEVWADALRAPLRELLERN